MEPKKSFSVYKLATILSVVLHLFFVTTVEAAVFLSKTFAPSFHEPLVTIKTIHHESVLRMTPSTRIERKRKVSKKEKAVNSNAVRMNEALSEKKAQAKSQNLGNALSANGAFQRFQNFQAKMDKRIEQFRQNLLDLAAQDQKADPSDSLMSHVFDLEKVPVEVRKDLLPDYLRKMRFKIATEWLRQIRNLHFESEVATVRYQIAQDGTMSDLGLQSANPSGSPLFLKSCLKAIEHASPFDPLPFQFQDSEREKYLTIFLTFYLRKHNQKALFSLEHFRP